MQAGMLGVVDTLAARLRHARDVRGLTQAQLSEMSGVKQSDISKIETGKSFSTTGMAALARALRCDVDWLDTGEGDPDFGRIKRGWPFSMIDRRRFAKLTDPQRQTLEGFVMGLLTQLEAGGEHPVSGESSTSQPDHGPKRHAA